MRIKRFKVITDFGRLALPLLDMILHLDFYELSFALSRARTHLVCI